MSERQSSAIPIVIDLADKTSVGSLLQTVQECKEVRDSLKESITRAAETIQTYDITNQLSASQIHSIYKRINIDDTQDPTFMNNNLKTTENVAIIHRTFHDSFATKAQFETVLFKIITDFSKIVAGDILSAIVDLVKSFTFICISTEKFNMIYKNVCFKFYNTKPNSGEVIILVMNLNYGSVHRGYSFARFLRFINRKVHVTFFGAVVRTAVDQALGTLPDPLHLTRVEEEKELIGC